MCVGNDLGRIQRFADGFNEGGVHFLGAHAQAIAHQLIGLADQLHVTILDAVVDHLGKVSGAVFAHPVTAGNAIFHLGAD